MKRESFEDFVLMQIDSDFDDWTIEQFAECLEVSNSTISAWRKKVDWDYVKQERRKTYGEKTRFVDKALLKTALKGNVPAIELWFSRFDGYIPTSAQLQTHDLDEGLIDDELKRLMQLKSDTALVLKASVDDGGRKETQDVDSGEVASKAG